MRRNVEQSHVCGEFERTYCPISWGRAMPPNWAGLMVAVQSRIHHEINDNPILGCPQPILAQFSVPFVIKNENIGFGQNKYIKSFWQLVFSCTIGRLRGGKKDLVWPNPIKLYFEHFISMKCIEKMPFWATNWSILTAAKCVKCLCNHHIHPTKISYFRQHVRSKGGLIF